MKQDVAGNYWIGTNSGLYKFDGNEWKIFSKDNGFLPSNFINDIEFDLEGNIWIANYYHLVKLNPTLGSVFSFSMFDSLGFKVVKVAVDSNNTKWIGTDGGLYKFDDSLFTHALYGEIQELFFDGVSLWTGTMTMQEGGQIFKYSDNGFVEVTDQIGFTKYGYSDLSIHNIKKDRYGRIWISVQDGVAYLENNSWTVYDILDWNGLGWLNYTTPVGIAFDSSDNICVAIGQGALYIKHSNYWEKITETNSPLTCENWISDIFNDNQGKIWISTNEGVVVFEGNLTEININNSHWRANKWELWETSAVSIDTLYTKSELINSTSSQGFTSQFYAGKGTGKINFSTPELELTWKRAFGFLQVPQEVFIDYKILHLSPNVNSARINIGFNITGSRMGTFIPINIENFNEWQQGNSQLVIPNPNWDIFNFLSIGIDIISSHQEEVEFEILLDNLRFLYISNDTVLVESFGDSLVVNVNEKKILKFKDYQLSQNFPNPFNPKTKIKFQTTEPGLVVLKVYDLLGNEINKLVNDNIMAGSYEVEFDGSNLSSGIYFYELRASKFSSVRKMILLK